MGRTNVAPCPSPPKIDHTPGSARASRVEFGALAVFSELGGATRNPSRCTTWLIGEGANESTRGVRAPRKTNTITAV